MKNIWIIIDELASFEYIPSLDMGLREIRKFRGCILGAMQNIAQLREIYGYQGGQSMLDLFSNKFVFRSGEKEIAEYFSNLFGKYEIKEKKESLTFGSNDGRDNIHINESERMKSRVMIEDILQLKDLECYVKLAGPYSVAKMKFDIFKN